MEPTFAYNLHARNIIKNAWREYFLFMSGIQFYYFSLSWLKSEMIKNVVLFLVIEPQQIYNTAFLESEYS